MVSQVVLSWVAIVYAWLNCGKLILPPIMNYCWLSRYPHLMVNISPQSFSIFSECLSDQVATESSNGQQSAPAAGRRRDIGFPIKSRGFSKNIGISLYPYAPWCWYIYLQNWVIFRVHVGKYSIHGAFGLFTWIAFIGFFINQLRWRIPIG